jgi:hypothetical protein
MRKPLRHQATTTKQNQQTGGDLVVHRVVQASSFELILYYQHPAQDCQTILYDMPVSRSSCPAGTQVRASERERETMTNQRLVVDLT